MENTEASAYWNPRSLDSDFFGLLFVLLGSTTHGFIELILVLLHMYTTVGCFFTTVLFALNIFLRISDLAQW